MFCKKSETILRSMMLGSVIPRSEDSYHFICVLIISYNIANSYSTNVTPLT